MKPVRAGWTIGRRAAPTARRVGAVVMLAAALATTTATTMAGGLASPSTSIGVATPKADEPITPYIINGDLVTIGDHPHYTQVLAYRAGATSFCGGSIVAPRIVLTAGHCVFGFSAFEVRVGSDQFLEGRRVGVQDAILHPSYNPETSRNDLALLVLSAPVEQRPIRIIGPSSDYRWQGDGHTFTVVGMGCTGPIRSQCSGPSDVLRGADVVSRSDGGCDVDLSPFGGIDSRTMLCAGLLADPVGSHTAPNACFGDSGGPLTVVGHDGSPRLVGAVSWGGATCGDYPLAYTRLAKYRSWLREHGVPIERDPFEAGPEVNVNVTAIPLVGDFNGDTRDDVLWYRPGAGADQMKYGTASGGFVAGAPIDVNGTFTPSVGDFNGDGVSDIFWYRPGSGADVIALGRPGGTFRQGPAIDIDGTFTPVAGDFNGDGRDDVVLYGRGPLPDQLRLGTPIGRLGSGPPTSIGGSFDVATSGDFTGDGIDDIAWYGYDNAPDLVRRGSPDGVFRSGPTLEMGDELVPIGGDYNGDRRADVLWFSPSGDDRLREMSPTGGFVHGPEVRVDGAFTPFGGDFNGDGVGDVFWYRPGLASDVVWRGRP